MRQLKILRLVPTIHITQDMVMANGLMPNDKARPTDALHRTSY